MKSRINWHIIASNVNEARQQLEEIEAQVARRERVDEADLKVMLEHAFHHINFAWNARRAPMRRYLNLSDTDFNRWGKFPKDIELLRLPVQRKSRPTSNQSASPVRSQTTKRTKPEKPRRGRGR
jgi:hypothetical protein